MSPSHPACEQPKVLAVIPARYASTRFPGKPLVDIQGKPMIRHVWERVRGVPAIQRIIVATDDERIAQTARTFGAEVAMTSPAHPSGTDRLWEVAQTLPAFEWVLNVQGDEPFINPAHLQAALEGIQRFAGADIITLVTPIHTVEDWREPNLVKAVLTAEGRALYFSRAPVPYHRDAPDLPQGVYRHIGLYLYRRTALERFTQLPPSPLEQMEKLEQLRALEAGMTIYAAVVSEAPVGVDTPADLIRIRESLG
ncbi:3-deoxy-manno-octulosonate cytidylyltransferase [Vampirovibrio chlorellavorus]|uniref:3-deoxy-manno-octulosonate cytidylyltransferase n=1 Tax=Vampirovibrio chlorellavorus TaxID=758823 RepID=UPI0026ED8F31|nr:3-deoxy-manno-octulosonate cytidylyltransferase [Vampirovibrio chlorellavorus]